MRMNPIVLTIWVFGACVGYLIGGDLTGAIAGLTVGLGITLFASLIG